MASEVQPLCTQTSGPGLAEEEARSLEAMEIPDTSPLLLVWVPGPEAPNVVLTTALDTVPTILPKLFNTQNNPMK